MDKGEICEGEGEKEEASNSLVSSQVICDDIVLLLDYAERRKNENNDINLDEEDDSDRDEEDDSDRDEEYDSDRDEEYDSDLDEEDDSDRDEEDDSDRDEEYDSDLDEEDDSDVNHIKLEKLILSLKTMLRLVQLSHLDDFNATMSRKSNEILSRKDANLVSLRIVDYIKSCLKSQNQSKSSATMPEEKLIELLDSLVMILHDLSSAESISPFMTQYRALQNVCSTIRDFHRLKVNGVIEPEIVEYYTPQFQLMAERVGPLCWALFADSDEDDSDEEVDLPRIDVMLAHLYMKIIHVHLEVMHLCFTKLKDSKSAEVGHFINQLLEASPDILREYLMYLEDHMLNVTSASTSAREIHVMIELLLVILTDIPIDSIRHDKLFDLLVRVGAISKEVGVLVHSIQDKSSNEESINKTNCTVLHLLDDLKHVYLKAPDPTELCFNMSDGPLFMNLLLRHLNDLFNSNAYSVDLIKEEIGRVKEHLEFIRSKFRNVEQELHKDIWKRVLDVAYEAKHVIDSILARDDGLLHLVFSLPNAMKKIKLIKEEVSILHEMIPMKRGGLFVVNSPRKPDKSMPVATSKIIVGFKEETDEIIRKLTNGPAELDVISIIGMPGLGKTTLAYKVYNDRSVISHFDIRAWCTVDQEYDSKMILHKILNQVTGSDEKLREDTDVDDVLRKKLYGRRCLIVLDDLWDTATWDDLTRPFRQVEKGSRIILTSRKKEVALHGKRHSDPLYLRLLRLEESWELLEKRVFRDESCPVELLDVGKEIAKNCGGLPLVADLIAGVIARREKERSLWLEVLENLNSFIFEDEVEVMRVTQLSYDHLSDHLRLCFLYLGSYRKDEEIEVNELKVLWSAEGFVEESEMKSMEEVTEDYLNDLVSSSLVMVSKGEDGEKVCQIHDLVHDFCLIKAKKEKLFESISSSAPSSSSSSSSSSLDLMTRQLIIHDSEGLPQSCENIFLFDSQKKRDSSGKHLLSLKVVGDLTDNFICHLRHLRLLRVLNLEEYHLPNYLLDEIGMLVHLRCLNTGRMNIEALPSAFSNLLNLETLVVSSNDTVMVEPVIWNLPKLRHVYFDEYLIFGSGTDEPTALAEDSKLENLRILATLCLSYSEGGYDILKRFPNLQKLCCYLKDTWDSSTGFNRYPEFGFHNELEELRLEGPAEKVILSSEAKQPHDLPFFPSSLKSLTLCYGSVTSESLSTIARLPNLQELHLRGLFILGKEWNMREDDTFENLKILKLYKMEFSEWQVGEESFPMVEHLTLEYCEELKEIPSSFGDIDSLKCIELIGSPQLKYSAQQIKQYVEELTGEDKLEVIEGYR